MPSASRPAPDASPDAEPIYDTQFAEDPDGLAAYDELVAVVRQLRRDCPWDRAQTHASVRHLVIEETYELVAAIDVGDRDALREELGDVLLHVLFHAAIAEEAGRFRLADVIRTETRKLVRRHPHVFGDVDAGNEEAVRATWEQVKQQERREKGGAPASTLDGVPAALPSLLRAHRIQQKAAGVGFDFPAAEPAWDKVEEELREFRAAEGEPAREEELGDLLFAVVNYARLCGLNAENALRRTNDKFTQRFGHVERRLAEAGTTPAEADLETMDRYWEEAKGCSAVAPEEA